MSNDLRQNELDCLNKIRDSFVRLIGIKKEFDNSNYSTMETILISAYQNEKHNDFPDFFFDGGIIEHFEVTASNETGKGSKYKVDDARRQKEKDWLFQQLDKEFINSPFQPGTITVKTTEDIYDYFSYESFVKSFKRNISNHLRSLSNSKYLTNQIVVFIIEQQPNKLNVYVNNAFDRFYKLSEDKKLLLYLKETLLNVNYLIFTVFDAYEIIDLSKIDSMIASAKEDLDVRGGRHINISAKSYLDYK